MCNFTLLRVWRSLYNLLTVQEAKYKGHLDIRVSFRLCRVLEEVGVWLCHFSKKRAYIAKMQHFLAKLQNASFLMRVLPYFRNIRTVSTVQKPNSWTYNFVEVSGHNLENSQKKFRYNAYITNQFRATFARGGGGGSTVKSVQMRKILKTFVPITSENSASVSENEDTN